MSTRKRIGIVAGGLLTVAGIYTFPSDMLSLITTVWEARRENPVGVLLITAGAVLAGYSLRDELLRVFGIQTEKRLVQQLTNWLHYRNEYELRETKVDKQAFSLVARRADTNIIIEKTKGIRTMNVQCGLALSKEDKAALEKASLGLRMGLFQQIGIDLSKRGVQFRLDADDNTWMIERLEIRKSVDSEVGLVMRASKCASLLMSMFARRAAGAESAS